MHPHYITTDFPILKTSGKTKSVLFATRIEYPITQLPEPTSGHPRHKDHREYCSGPRGAFLGPLDSLPAHIEGGQALAEATRGDYHKIIPRPNQSSSSSLVIESGTEPYCHSSGKGQEGA